MILNFLPIMPGNKESSNLGDVSEDDESLSSSMSHFLDSESDLAYCPSSCSVPSQPSPGSKSSSSNNVDIEPSQEEIHIQDDSGIPWSSPSMTDLGGGGCNSGPAAGRVEGPISSKPPIKCCPE
jgi:hypothetical protein